MPFPGEDRYREAVARAKSHEGDSAMVKVSDLEAALTEIDLLRLVSNEYNDLIRHMNAGGDFFAFQSQKAAEFDASDKSAQ